MEAVALCCEGDPGCAWWKQTKTLWVQVFQSPTTSSRTLSRLFYVGCLNCHHIITADKQQNSRGKDGGCSPKSRQGQSVESESV